MVDANRLRDELRRMRELIDSDPRVKARFDRDGNGVIDGEEWEQVRQLVIRRLEREEAEVAARTDALIEEGGAEEELPLVVGTVAAQIYEEDLPVLAGASVSPSLALPDCHDVIVEERGLAPVFSFLRRNYALLTPDGREIGAIEQREMEWLQGLTTRVGGGAPDLHFDVVDFTTNERYTFRRSTQLFGTDIFIFDGAERQVGFVKEKLGVLKPTYRVVSTFQRAHVSVKWSLLHPFTLTVCDLMDDPVGKIERGWSGLGAFLTGPNRLRIRTDPEQFDPGFRWGLIAASILAEMGQEERDRHGGLLGALQD